MNEQEYEVWCEGYAATSERGSAWLVGKYKAASFRVACFHAAIENGWEGLYNPEKNTFWACRLFDNELEAREAFG